MTSSRVSGALILAGCALIVMAFVMLGMTGTGSAPVSFPAPPASSSPSGLNIHMASPAATEKTARAGRAHEVLPSATEEPRQNYREATGGTFTAGYVAPKQGPERRTEMLDRGSGVDPTPAAEPAPPPTPTPVPRMPRATHISVPAVGIETDIVEMPAVKTQIGDQTVFTWHVADWAAGHHETSAHPGESGNIVLSGHDDVRGEVFRGLHDIEPGAEVHLTSEAGVFTYVVTEIHLREYRDAPVEELIAAGDFLAPMPNERVTLVTCWPYRVDTHRLIVVAKPKEAS